MYVILQNAKQNVFYLSWRRVGGTEGAWNFISRKDKFRSKYTFPL